MKLRFSFFYLSIISVLKLFSSEVIIAKIDIPYNIALSPSNVSILQLNDIPKDCEPITIDELKKDKYFTKKYLQKDNIICQKDLKRKSNNKVIFNFGSIEIETNGKILYENDEYIKIKRDSGTIEKIYKDGRAR